MSHYIPTLVVLPAPGSRAGGTATRAGSTVVVLPAPGSRAGGTTTRAGSTVVVLPARGSWQDNYPARQLSSSLEWCGVVIKMFASVTKTFSCPCMIPYHMKEKYTIFISGLSPSR